MDGLLVPQDGLQEHGGELRLLVDGSLRRRAVRGLRTAESTRD